MRVRRGMESGAWVDFPVRVRREGVLLGLLQLMLLAVCNHEERGDGIAVVVEIVHLDRTFALSERCPREDAKAEVNYRGIHCVEGVLELEPVLWGDIPASFEQAVEQVLVDAIVACAVGVGERRSLSTR